MNDGAVLPWRRLVFAVLARAVEDARRPVSTYERRYGAPAEEARDALYWIFTAPAGDRASYESLCGLVGWSPDYVRSRLRADARAAARLAWMDKFQKPGAACGKVASRRRTSNGLAAESGRYE